ncbi:MAG: DUF4440 domain-containing protein [Flavobacteriaceae bacterium]|nr:MAG: DUF4440 domain-containing protein [Flavobacteriaceae bacterium]
MRLKIIDIVLLFFCTTGFSQNYIGEEKEIDIILENSRKFSTYVVSANYDMIGESYTNDAKIFPQNSRIIEGKDSILNYWRLPDGVRTVHHKLMPEEIKIMGKEAYDYGYYEGITKTANGKERTWKGKYVVVWRKEGGHWKMYLDIWNSTP